MLSQSLNIVEYNLIQYDPKQDDCVILRQNQAEETEPVPCCLDNVATYIDNNNSNLI